MNAWMKRCIAVAVVLQAGFAWAEDYPWKLRLGASYRNFDDVEFEAAAFPNWGGQNNPAGPYGVQNITAVPAVVGGGYPFYLDYVRYNGSSEGIDSGDRFAPIIGFGYDLMQAGTVQLALVGNFQYYRLNFGAGATGTALAPGDFSFEQYVHFSTGVPQNTVIPGVSQPPTMAGTTFSVRNEFKMDMYVLDLGLEARTTKERFNVTFALGPSLTITDAESSQRQRASWISQGPPAAQDAVPAEPGRDVGGASDSSTDVLAGAYAALGVTADVNRCWTVGLQLRYDYVDGDAGTDQVEMDLSGMSAILGAAYRF